MVAEAASLLDRAAVFPRGLGAASRLVQAVVFLLDRAGDFLLDLGVASRWVHVGDCPLDHAREMTRR